MRSFGNDTSPITTVPVRLARLSVCQVSRVFGLRFPKSVVEQAGNLIAPSDRVGGACGLIELRRSRKVLERGDADQNRRERREGGYFGHSRGIRLCQAAIEISSSVVPRK